MTQQGCQGTLCIPARWSLSALHGLRDMLGKIQCGTPPNPKPEPCAEPAPLTGDPVNSRYLGQAWSPGSLSTPRISDR